MVKINYNNLPFNYYNPYRSQLPLEKENPCPDGSQLPKDSWEKIKDSITAWAETHLFTDYEKEIDFAGRFTKILDQSVFTVVGTMNTIVLADKLFHLKFQKLPILRTFPLLLPVLNIPLNMAFFGFAVAEIFTEMINFRRETQLLRKLNISNKNPFEKLEWIRKRYFSLKSEEEEKIKQCVEKHLNGESPQKKAEQFDLLAGKVLKWKYQRLKRRISSPLAKEVLTQINGILCDLESSDSTIIDKAYRKAEILFTSISRQAKNKIFVNILEITALGISIVSMILFLAGISAGVFFTIMAAASLFLGVLSLLIEHGKIDKEVEKLYNAMHRFNLHIKEHLTPSPSYREAL